MPETTDNRAPAGTWVLRGGTVVDPRDGSAHRADVVVAGATIREVTEPTADRPGEGRPDRVVDVTGRWVIPGLNDMHAHPHEHRDPRGCLTLMLAHGVTGYRQMSGSTALLRRRRAGDLPGADGDPDLPALLATPGALLTPFNAGTATQVAATVREQHAEGADFVKAVLVTREVFAAAQEEGRRLGIAVSGHLPAGLDVERASRAGIGTIEHLGPGVGLFAPCSTHDHAVRDAARSRPSPPAPPVRIPFADRLLGPVLRRLVVNPANLDKPEDVAILHEAVRTFDEGRARELARRFVEDGTWNVPTLVRQLTIYRSDDPAREQDPDLRYVDPAALTAWRTATARFHDRPAEARATYVAAYDLLRRLTGIFADEGVPMLAGSDVCGAAWLVPGAALHHELDELAGAGLDPLTVLRMATNDPARHLGRDTAGTEGPDAMGAVAPGHAADLVVLRADPLRDVAALHEVESVVRAGRHHDRPALDGMLARVAADRSAA